MEKAQQILFIGLSCVGDVVMTTPLIRSLHSLFPEARFDFVVDGRSKALYENCPYRRQIFEKNKNKFMRGLPELLKQLWRYKYDLIVDVRTDGMAYLLRGKKRLTKFNSVPYGEHAVEKLMGVIAPLHKDKPIPDTEVWMCDEHAEYARNKLSVFKDKSKLLAISTGEPSKPHKNWMTDKWIQFLDEISNHISGLVFIGGPNEVAEISIIKERVKTPFIDVAGNSSLLESAAILKQMSLYVGPDSGPGHLAAADDTKTITLFSLFGPERYLPWGKKAFSVRGEENDARNISVAEIVTLFNRVI